MRKTVLMLFCMIFVHGCSKTHFHADNMQAQADSSDAITRVLEITGNMDLMLINSKTAPTLAFNGKSSILQGINVDETNDRIIIKRVIESNEKVLLTINIFTLTSLSYEGNATIQSTTDMPLNLKLKTDGKINVLGPINLKTLLLEGTGKVRFNKLNSQDLKLTISGSLTATIEGSVKLTKLDMSDCGWVKIFWNNSEHLKITGTDQAFAQIAGVVFTLDVDLHEGAHFNGKYLRAEIAYVKTYGIARADIYAKSMRHAVSSDESNIYTYKEPKIKFDGMFSSGSVMER